MIDLKKILFPVDFSPKCRDAAPFVSSLARRFDARLTLLHAITTLPESCVTYGLDVSKNLKKQLQEAAATSMDSLVKQEFESALGVSKAIEEGDPADVIARYVQNEAMDLVMMPTHGYGPVRRFLIGSVTAKVLHDVQCPMWTSVHVGAAAKPPESVQTILCALDSGPSCVSLMRWASSLAGRYGAALKLVHVIPAVNETSMNPGEQEVRRYLFCKAKDEFAAWRREAGEKAEVQLRGGEIASRVADTALQEHADFLVIGRGHIQRALGGLRTESLAIIREAPCPVFSV